MQFLQRLLILCKTKNRRWAVHFIQYWSASLLVPPSPGKHTHTCSHENSHFCARDCLLFLDTSLHLFPLVMIDPSTLWSMALCFASDNPLRDSGVVSWPFCFLVFSLVQPAYSCCLSHAFPPDSYPGIITFTSALLPVEIQDRKGTKHHLLSSCARSWGSVRLAAAGSWVKLKVKFGSRSWPVPLHLLCLIPPVRSLRPGRCNNAQPRWTCQLVYGAATLYILFYTVARSPKV